MTSTPDIIDRLVIDAKPVQRLQPPALRALYWLLFAALILVLVAVGHGVRPDLMLKLRQPAFATSVAAALMTGVLAAVASFMVSVPGRSRRWSCGSPPLAMAASRTGSAWDRKACSWAKPPAVLPR